MPTDLTNAEIKGRDKSPPNFQKYLNYFRISVIIIIQKESTHSKGGCSEFRHLIVLTDDAYPVDQTG